ncbi:MAG: hypothetical protein QNJ29_00650 [Rhizobiaceae bacterium]|nr:hypothetical protein [Rhizobiaceae bacterium]
MTDMSAQAQTFETPTINSKLLTTAVLAGAFATLGFDLFGQTISPLLKDLFAPYLGAKLAPVALANQSLGIITGLGSKLISQYGIGHGIHLLTGLILYPLGYMLIARPISKKVTPFLPWWGTGAVYGVALFVFALYIMAHLVAGNPPFLGWGSITWVALWGHMVFGLIVAGVHHWRHEK